MKKRIAILAIITVLLMTVMTQTAFAFPKTSDSSVNQDNQVMPLYTGVIADCPNCGRQSLHTCAGPSGFYDTDIDCDIHTNCVLQQRQLYYTKATCNFCYYGNAEGGGDGIYGMHVQTWTHSLTGISHNACRYSS